MNTTLDTIRTAVSNTAPGTDDLTANAFASAVWSIIGEPGDQTAGHLIDTLGPSAALQVLLEDDSPSLEGFDVQTLRERTLPRATAGLITGAFRTAARFGAALLTPEHPHWPAGLVDLGTSSPHALWVRGNSELLTATPSTAIVGARAATGYGEHVTMEISAGLVGRGHTIISGAAYGIDGMAHRAALASHGKTIAYLAGGVDRYYPSGHDALLTPEHAHWPTGLADLGTSTPHAFWVRGNSELLTATPSTAIVGARAATGYGEHVTMEITAGLVERGHTIISGAAYGIDGMAHRAALASHGSTIAYLAGGVDRYYPSAHDALLTRIAEEGAVVSELACGQPPTKWRFLMRNRLIASHSQRTVVVEAGWRSGSLNTAGHAANIGRPLGAVPGPVTSAASAGCHRLIRDYSATLVTNANEIAQL